MFDLEKLQLKHSICSKKFTEMLRCQELGFLSGTRGSEREERMWKMILRVEGQQQAEQNENVEHVREKVRSDRRLTVRMIADELSMNSERV